MAEPRRERLSISVSAETRAFIKSQAKAQARSESSVVELAVRRMRREERELAAMRAMMADAEEDRTIAAEWEIATPPVID